MRKRFAVRSAVLALSFGVGLSVAQADQFTLSGAEFAKASGNKAVAVEPMMQAKMDAGSGFFVSAYAAYDYAFLGGLGADEKNLNDFAKGLGDPNSDGEGGSGILGGVALGMDLDKSNALSVNLEKTWTQQSGLNVTSGSDAGAFQTFDPSLLGITLNYQLVVAQGGGSKTTLTAGAGYYHGSVHYAGDISGPGTITGDFGQDNIGGTVGVSEQLDLGGSLDLGFSAKFRVADFGKLTSSTVTQNGTTSGSGGPFVMVTDTVSNPYTSIYPVPTSYGTPPSGYHYTNLDYTGFNGDVSLTLHL